MKINKIQEPQASRNPACKMKYQRVIRYDSATSKRIIDKIKLDNGKEITSAKAYFMDELFYKFQYLKDAAGQWVKSKLRYYKGRNLAKTMEGKKDDIEV